MAKTNVKNYEVNQTNKSFKVRTTLKHILSALKALSGDAFVDEPVNEELAKNFEEILVEVQQGPKKKILNVKIDGNKVEDTLKKVRETKQNVKVSQDSIEQGEDREDK